MSALPRHLPRRSATLVLILMLASCGRSDPSPPTTAPVPSPPPAAQPARLSALILTPARLAALPAFARTSPMVFGQAPDSHYNWRFGETEDELMVWANFEPAWSVTEFSDVVITSGYMIKSDLAPELDLVAAILEMERAEVEKKIIPTQVIEGHTVEVFGTGEFTANGLTVHYAFEDNSGVNGHHKPDLLVAIMPEAAGAFEIERARKKKNEAKQ